MKRGSEKQVVAYSIREYYAAMKKNAMTQCKSWMDRRNVSISENEFIDIKNIWCIFHEVKHIQPRHTFLR